MKMNLVHPVTRITHCGISGSEASDLPCELVEGGAWITARCQMCPVLFLRGVSCAMLVAKAFDLESVVVAGGQELAFPLRHRIWKGPTACPWLSAKRWWTGPRPRFPLSNLQARLCFLIMLLWDAQCGGGQR